MGQGLLIHEVSRSHTTTHHRQISMPPVGFEPTISASEPPQTYVLDRATTGNGDKVCNTFKNNLTIMDNETCITTSGGSYVTATGLQPSHKFGEKFDYISE